MDSILFIEVTHLVTKEKPQTKFSVILESVPSPETLCLLDSVEVSKLKCGCLGKNFQKFGRKKNSGLA